MPLFCKHEWKVLDKTILPSAYEQLGEKATGIGTMPVWVFQKKVVLTTTCSKCGKMVKLIETNPKQ